MAIYLYLLDTMADWEVGYILAELNSGRFFDKSKPAASLVKIANTKDAIATMGGIAISPDVALADVNFSPEDILILPGSDTWGADCNQAILSLAPKLLKHGVTIAAICGATIALANQGMLDARKHTSNDKDFLQMICQSYVGAEYYVEEPAVTDRNLITASGLAPLEFAYEVFKKVDAFKPETIESWYKLNSTKEAKYYFEIVSLLD